MPIVFFLLVIALCLFIFSFISFSNSLSVSDNLSLSVCLCLSNSVYVTDISASLSHSLFTVSSCLCLSLLPLVGRCRKVSRRCTQMVSSPFHSIPFYQRQQQQRQQQSDVTLIYRSSLFHFCFLLLLVLPEPSFC